MLLAIKSLFAPKQRARIILRGRISVTGVLTIQQMIRGYNLPGWMRAVGSSHAEITIEGPRPRIDAVLDSLKTRGAVMGVQAIEVGWQAYKGNLEYFRVAQ